MSTNNNAEEAVHVEANINTPTSANTSTSKPSFPCVGKFISNEHEEMRVQLNGMALATNAASHLTRIQQKHCSSMMRAFQ